MVPGWGGQNNYEEKEHLKWFILSYKKYTKLDQLS